jgi:hypothetical protein
MVETVPSNEAAHAVKMQGRHQQGMVPESDPEVEKQLAKDPLTAVSVAVMLGGVPGSTVPDTAPPSLTDAMRHS